MPTFNYECMNKQGQVVRGAISSDTLSAAVDKLRSSGLAVLDIKEQREKAKSSFLSNEKNVKLADITLFSRQLASMLGAGIPVTRAISTLSRQSENPTLKNALEDIARNIEGGMSLTDAFSAYPKIFPKIYVSMLRAGEVGGKLENTLLRLSDQLQKEKQLKDNIKIGNVVPQDDRYFYCCRFCRHAGFHGSGIQGVYTGNGNHTGDNQGHFLNIRIDQEQMVYLAWGNSHYSSRHSHVFQEQGRT